MEIGNYKELEEKMEKSLNAFKEELLTIRAGRANPSVLNKITVNYYGVPTPINQIGNISTPEPRILIIQPWDTSILKEVEKEIQKSDLGLNPINDGKIIRISFPELTEDRRKELVKSIKKKAEDIKIALRSIRRDAIDKFKTMQKNHEITEDDLKDAETVIQKKTDNFIEQVDKVAEGKEKEIMEI